MGMDYRSLWICSPYVSEVMPICYVPSDVLEKCVELLLPTPLILVIDLLKLSFQNTLNGIILY